MKEKFIPTNKLKKSDIPDLDEDTWDKQLSFIWSFFRDSHYGEPIYKKRLDLFRKKSELKKYEDITIDEIRTALIFHVRNVTHQSGSVSKEFLKKIYDLLKEKIKE